MRRVLEHFKVDGSYGWNQDHFPDFFMRMGGCAAVTACDSCVYFALRMGMTDLVDFDPARITRADYLRLARRMKQTLGPRMRGVDRLEIYQDGFARYLQNIGAAEPVIRLCHGEESFQRAQECLTRQIDAGYPVPFLLLRHHAAEFEFYVWHWFLLMGYEDVPVFRAQAVTYGFTRWLDFRRLWDTGFAEKGGMILFSRGTDGLA